MFINLDYSILASIIPQSMHVVPYNTSTTEILFGKSTPCAAASGKALCGQTTGKTTAKTGA